MSAPSGRIARCFHALQTVDAAIALGQLTPHEVRAARCWRRGVWRSLARRLPPALPASWLLLLLHSFRR